MMTLETTVKLVIVFRGIETISQDERLFSLKYFWFFIDLGVGYQITKLTSHLESDKDSFDFSIELGKEKREMKRLPRRGKLDPLKSVQIRRETLCSDLFARSCLGIHIRAWARAGSDVVSMHTAFVVFYCRGFSFSVGQNRYIFVLGISGFERSYIFPIRHSTDAGEHPNNCVLQLFLL
jgi:hypothetical protein